MCALEKQRENSAVTIGPRAMVIRTLATLVSVSATMKAVYITDQQTAEIRRHAAPERDHAPHSGTLPEGEGDGRRQGVEATCARR